jgi:RNA polymerase sigma-70 factor (ECF subfamily)
MAQEDEKQWLARAMAGDVEAFGLLADFYLPRIFNLCLGLTGNRQDAEDCAQDTFLKAFKAMGLYQAKSSFYTWLYRIAVNVCMDFQRSAHRRQAYSLDQAIGEEEQTLQIRDDSPLPDELAISHELGQQLLSQIGLLPEPMRDVLILRDIEGLAYEEIASLLRLSAGTVKSRLFRARGQVMRGMARQVPEQIPAQPRPTGQRGAER